VLAENKTVKVTKDDSIPATYKETAVVIREDSTHIMPNEDEGLKIKMARAGDAVNDFACSAVDWALNVVKSRAKAFYNSGVFEPGYAAARKDATDIARLGPLVTRLTTEFEGMETIVCEHSYPEQVKLLTGYKKLLEEQINVINSRTQFVKRLS
jgi:hypothetical protein